jgi:hypothetical protein
MRANNDGVKLGGPMRGQTRGVKWVSLMLLVGLSAAAAQARAMPFWGAKAPMPYDTPTEALEPGEFTWAPQIAPAGPVLVVVSLDEQRAYAYRNGVEIGASTISSGKQGHETPTGVFHTFLKDKDHHSSLYHKAAMPYTQKLTQDGIALHAGGIPGYPESHGCVHLPSEFARLLFDAAPLGMTVVIGDQRTVPADVDHPPLLVPVDAEGAPAETPRLAASEDYRWEPGASRDGPLAIIISGYDRRAVVLRGGLEIGRAVVAIDDPDVRLGTHAFVMSGPGTGEPAAEEGRSPEPVWVAVGIPGHMDAPDQMPDPEAAGRVRLPDEFLYVLDAELGPGSTLLITDAPILESTTGVQLAVLSSSPDDAGHVGAAD